ncbi:unnamed protein product [Brassica oleracea var. botrytis]
MGSIGKRKMMMKEEEKLSDQVQQSTCFQPAHVWSNVEPDISSINDVGLIPPWIRISLIRWENISGMQWIPKILAHLLVSSLALRIPKYLLNFSSACDDKRTLLPNVLGK